MTTEAKKDRKPRRTLTLKDRVADVREQIAKSEARTEQLQAKLRALIADAKAEADAIAAEIAEATS